jgi:hypothetical protein
MVMAFVRPDTGAAARRRRPPQASLFACAAGLAMVALSACAPPGPRVAGLPETVDFNFHVKPILSDRCFKCHGPDDAARKAGLRLDTAEGPYAKLESGTRAVVPGRPRRSELVRRILSDDPDVMMPAPESHLTLSDYEKALLIQWVDEGAEWRPHWSFTAAVQPTVPDSGPQTTARNEIDHFVLARLAAHGLSASPEASKETLIRRVSLVLTGLPPTVDEVDAFLGDPSADAYTRVVDRLLASPAYGERLATEWLDVARYADSHGYQDDGMRQMFPWRDWVIGAFNRNMPFNEFVTWQLAGDLLPDPTPEQRLATAFNRHHMQSQEGGIVAEEYRVEYVVDRVSTVGTALMGMSLGCARCHDHKYDPVTQREFFELSAFFNNNNDAGQIPYSGVPSPTVILPDDQAKAALEAMALERPTLERAAALDNPAFDAGFAAWLKRRSDNTPLPPPVVHLPLDGPRGQYPNHARPREAATLSGDKDRVPEVVQGRIGQAQRLVGDSSIQLPSGTGFFDRQEPFSFGLWVRVDQTGAAGPLVVRSGGPFNGFRGYTLFLEADGRLRAGLHHVAPDNSIEIETTTPLVTGAWTHVAFTWDGSSRAAGLRLFVDGTVPPVRVVIDNLQRSIMRSGIKDNEHWGSIDPLRIGGLAEETLQDVSVDDLRVYATTLTPFEVRALAGAATPLAAALAKSGRSPSEDAALREHYVRRVAPGYPEAMRALTALRRRENDVLTGQIEVMVMRERAEPRPAFVLARGAYDAPGERVGPGTPAALLPFADDLPRNRLGLARWLLDRKHPLTSRVIVNRYWAQIFGRGLVPTVDDFGSQGRLPSHPELLDWLALRFVDSGWDLKALIRQMVMSATFRQISVADVSAREADPDNEWLARGPSYRLSAEQIRDTALRASGLLVTKIGGPSVYPYQPKGLWEELATRNATTYAQGSGDDLYRRSLYTVWKRSTPPPSAISFDAGERMMCTVARQRTTTPLQALILLNDPQYVESARALAENVLRHGGASADERVGFAFRRVTSRAPSATERAQLTGLYATSREHFAAHPSKAVELRRVGERAIDATLDPVEVAAWTVVANTILNLDEVVRLR